MDSFTKKEQIAIFVIVLIVIISIGYKFFIQDFLKDDEESFGLIGEHLEESDDEIMEEDINDENYDIMVHVSGEVYRPGLVTLSNGDRVIDAVNLSGGLKNQADLDRINLAKKVQDEEKIYIPRIGEESTQIGDTSESAVSKININTCTKSDLETLPGIGAITADKIIEYRESNSFKQIEDIMNVSGIGEKKFESIKELIIAN